MAAYTSPQEAEQGLTSAFKPNSQEQTAAIKNAASLVPTVLTGANISEKKIPEMDAKVNKFKESGAVMGPDGVTRYADGTAVPQEDPDLGQKRQQAGTYIGQDGQQYYNYDSSPLKADKTEEGTFANMKLAVDAQTKRKIDSIEQNIALKRQLQQEANDSTLGGLRRDLLTSGSSRYANKSSQGVLSAEQKALETSIQSLNTQEQSLIADALASQENKEYEILGQQLALIETKRKEKQAKIDKLNDAIAAENKAIQESIRQSSRDSAVAGLLSQGVTDPSQLLDYLNFDEEGNQTGDFTADELKKTMDDLSVSGDAEKLPGDIETFNYLKKNGMLPSGITSLPEGQQYLAYLNMQKLAESGKLNEAGKIAGEPSNQMTVGAGAKNSTEETIIRTRLFSKLMNILNKGQVSDSDREIIDSRIAVLRGAGLSEQEIMDQLSGFAVEVNTPFNSAFRDTIVANTDDLDKQTQTMGKVSMLLNSGNYNAALNTIENLSLDRAKQILGTGSDGTYMGTGTAQIYLSRLERIRDLLKKGDVGPITGTFNNLIGRVRGTEAAQIKAELTQLYALFRKENLGSAVTPSESAFLSPLLADISDRSGSFGAKLDAFERGVLDRANATRRQVSIPAASTQEFIDNGKRLNLYSSGEAANPFTDSVGNSGNPFLDAQGGFNIPK